MALTSNPIPHRRGFRTQVAVPFEQQINRFKGTVGNNVELFMRMFGHEMAEELMWNTPYITGWLRGSWLVGFHSNLRRQGSFDANGAATVNEMQMKIATYKLGQRMYFMNTAVYSWWVERGTSKMVGRYYMRRAVHSAPEIAMRVAQRISSTQ